MLAQDVSPAPSARRSRHRASSVAGRDIEPSTAPSHFASHRKAARIILYLVLIATVRDDGYAASDRRHDYASMTLEEILQLRIVSASQLEEPLAEAPVPVTVITAEMIQRSGVRNLKDLLTLYVPGMSFVQDHNEVNVAMRGVYSSSQQKILVLLNGHRLNSRAYSMANPDHSMGLDKLKQIEVLRGPGSSLYGNVALTAVINLVLKDGSDLQGGETSAGFGSHGQRQASFNFGRSFGEDRSFFSWFYFYENEGETISIAPEDDYARQPAAEPGQAILGGFTDQPSLDVGFNGKWGKLGFLANRRQSHYVEPFSGANLTGEAYQYENYEPVRGVGPGLQSTSSHFELSYNRRVASSWDWSSVVTYDINDVDGVVVLNPAAELYALISWNDYSHGLASSLRYSYERGNALFGYQFDGFEVRDSDAPFGTGGRITGELFTDENPVLRPGRETTHSLFAQVKHRLNDRWLVNVGIRLDDKDRLTGSNVSDVSPRVALIYQSPGDAALKLSYASSFVDPPYWNRSSALPSFRGSVDLQPEHLDSLQVSPSFRWMEGRLSYTANVFYNRLTDFVFRNNQASSNEPIYSNAGELESIGVEHELSYVADSLKLHLNASKQEVLNSRRFAARGDEVFNVPNEAANLIVDLKLPGETWLNVGLRFIGARLSPTDINLNGVRIPDPFPQQGVEFFAPDRRLDSVLLVDAGADIAVFPRYGLRFDARIYNLFDHQWEQGGSTLHPYPQEGRWFLARARYRW